MNVILAKNAHPVVLVIDQTCFLASDEIRSPVMILILKQAFHSMSGFMLLQL